MSDASVDGIIGKLAAGLVGALLVWLVSKFYNRSRLYCAPSRLYEYSTLADGSSTVQLVIANRGRKTEELVEIQLSTDYEYHLLAATQNGIEIPKDKAIRLPALLPRSEVSLVIVAEGKPRFSKDGIRSVRSKHSLGSVGASLSEAEASSPGAAAAAIALLLIVAVFGYAIGSTVGEDAWRWSQNQLAERHAQEFNEGCVTVRSSAPLESENGLTEAHLKGLALAAVEVKRVALVGDALITDVEVTNIIEGPVDYALTLVSHASDSTVDWSLRRDRSVQDIVMLDKGEVRSYTLSDYFPPDRKPKRFWLETNLKLFGYWVEVRRSFFFGEDASMSCPLPAANTSDQ